jgi:nucleoside-diphosphate-sugar epimerase
VIQLTADLLHDERVRDALAHADVVYHLAGCPDVRDPRPDANWRRHRDNVLVTDVVLAAVPRRTRVVITSSSSIYGGAALGRASTERDEPQPRGGYAISKLTMEQHCKAQVAAGADILVVRPFTVAGEGQRLGMALSRWITAVQAGAPIQILGSLERSRDITDVAQVVTALTQLAGTQARGTVNLGTGLGRTLREMVTAVERAVGAEARYEVVPAAREEVEHTLADTDKLRSLLGWVPVTDLDALVARQAAAMAAQPESVLTAAE